MVVVILAASVSVGVQASSSVILGPSSETFLHVLNYMILAVGKGHPHFVSLTPGRAMDAVREPCKWLGPTTSG